MTTSKSPRKVLKTAYALGWEVLPKYVSAFSRHDEFTKPSKSLAAPRWKKRDG